jgi:carotenoid cleavage dioxygenase-like enzyme
MTRRHFCKATLAAVAGTGLHSMPSLAAEHALPHQAFASSFKDVPESFGPTRVAFDRPLPADLSGTLYRNGPALMQRGNTRYQHWFDGDGMVHSFSLHGNTVTHTAKLVQTDKLVAEEAAGRFLWSGFGTSISDSHDVMRPDNINAANTSVLPLDNEVLALWEAGSPWRMDAHTLDTLGRKVFSDETDGLPFSAHPRTDPSGRIWSFGYQSGSGKLVLYELTSSGQLSRTGLVDAPNADMVHDFAITDRYLVFVLSPLHYRNNSDATISFMQRLEWSGDDPVHLLLIDKQNLQVAHRFELPPFFAFHFGNAWQDDRTVRIEVATAEQFHPLMQQIQNATTGQPIIVPPSEPSTAEIVIDLEHRRASLQKLPTSGIDFPRFDQRLCGKPTNHLYMLGRSQSMPNSVFGFNTVTAMNRSRDSEQIFDYGNSTIAEEHLFVPAPGPASSAANGWLIGTSYNWQRQLTTLAVFDAAHIADGPIASAELPYGLPLGLHGQFV